MVRLRPALGLICLLCLFLPFTARPDGGEPGPLPLLLLRSELRASRTVLVQTALRRPGLICVLDARRQDGEVMTVRGGLESAVLTAGPLKPKGLLRLLFRPLCYRPGSDLFQEDTDLRLDRSLNPCRRAGLLLEPLPGHLGLFSFSSPEKKAKSGGYLCLGLGEVRLEALALTSRPEQPEQAEEWLSLPAPYPGGRLLHLGARAGCAVSGWNLNLFAAVCGGERTPPGHTAQLAVARRSGGKKLALAGGICSPGFLTPDGRGGLPRLRAGICACLGDRGPLRVRGLAELLLKPSGQACAVGLRREYREELSARLLLPVRDAVWRLEGKAVVESAAEQEEPAHLSTAVSGEAELAREGPGLAVALGLKNGGQDRGNELGLEISSRRGGLKWSASLEARAGCAGSSACLRAGGEVELARKDGRFYLRLSCRDWLDPGRLTDAGAGLIELTSLTLGWETRAPLPAERVLK